MRKSSDIFIEFERIRQRMEQAWHQMVGSPPAPRFCSPIFEPAVDVYETEDQVVVLIDIADINEHEVDISVDGKTLSFRGERQPRQGPSGRLYSQMEICYGTFQRNILLPTEVDPDKAQADYRNGLLEILLPKMARQINRQVPIVAR